MRYVLVLVLVGLLALIPFGTMVRSRAQGHETFGWLGAAAYQLASVPSTIKALTKNFDRMVARTGGEIRFAGRTGWTGDPATAGLSGYLLLSRYDGDARKDVIELIDLATLKPAFVWQPDPVALFEGHPLSEKSTNTPLDPAIFRALHPEMLENGDLLIKDMYSPLARMDACNRKVWSIGGAFHHSTERASDGSFWIPDLMKPARDLSVSGDFFDDSIAQVSPDGEVLFEKSVTRMLIENGYEYLLRGMTESYQTDPVHLNDIQPALSDGAFWKAGDLFLSLRHRSTILIYRPSEDRIVWLKSGPWSTQHDVDILTDHTIGVFNNNMYFRYPGPVVDPASLVTTYDFTTDSTQDLLTEAFLKADVRTISEGLFAVLPNGMLMVEEANFGRILIFGAQGQIVLEYVNGAANGNPYRLGWVRFISREFGDAALSEIKALECAER